MVCVELTHRCNLRCPHCYNPSDLGEKRWVRDHSTLIKILRSIPNPHSVWLAFSGGEPLCYPELGTLVYAAKDIGFSGVHIDTNGTLLTLELLDQLVDLGLKSIQVSLDGPQRVHDQLRGRGAFENTVRNVSCAANRGIEVTVNMIVCPKTISFISTVHQVASELGAKVLKIEPMIAKGRGRELSQPTPTRKLVRDVCSVIGEIGQAGGAQIVLDNLFAASLSSEKTLGCPSGRTFCHITLEGRLFHCPVFTEFAPPENDVTRGNFHEVWQKSHFLNRLRDPESYREACGNCLYLAECCGGCHARAKVATGSFFGRDPMCEVLGKRQEG